MKARQLILVGCGLFVGCAFALAVTWALCSADAAEQQVLATAPSKPDFSQVSTATIPEGRVVLRVDLRSKGDAKKEKTVWDGSLQVQGGRVVSIRSWQADPRDQIEENTWKLSTRHTIPWNRQQRARGHEAMPLKDGSLVVELASAGPETRLEFETEQGDFGFALSEVPPGTLKRALGGLVAISQIASTATILSAPTEDDYASAALGPDGALYVTYVAFTHGKDFRSRSNLPEEPEDLDYLTQPTGGDQVLLIRLEGDRWTGPLQVTPPGQDVYRTAISVDGSGRVWVFWSAKQGDRWDLFARCLETGRFSELVRLTNDAGPDAFPAAVTDSAGRVCVAWQAFRENNSDILAARQDGDGFGNAMVIAASEANEWEPAIAACSDGRIAVAWDTYQSGNYDVYCRIGSDGEFGETIAIAATLRGEMRPSITFDGASRLWVAYENSPEKWGKDWGALEKDGNPLYQGRTVSVRVWADGQLWQPADDPVHAFFPRTRGQRQKPRSARLAFPRLTADSTGRVWLAARSPRLGTRVGVGTTWFEHAAWYEGDRWSHEITCPDTDNILDNRPALVPAPSGKVLLITSRDGRFATSSKLPQWFVRQLRQRGEQVQQAQAEAKKWPDAVNNELVMAELGPAPQTDPVDVKLVAVENAEPAARTEETNREAEDVARARAARAHIGGITLQLVRGEFHRHTEISQDGGGDGGLLDMWRYALDATAMDWIGNGDHDNGGGREYSWWITQKTTDLFHIPGGFSPMYSYERSCSYPDGHRNVVFSQRGVRTLPRLSGGMGKAMDSMPADAKRPNTPDTQMLYRYLAHFDGVCASHTSGTDMGTDWRDNDSKVEPIVEIYQGCRQNYEMPGAPRSNTAENSIGGWRPLGFVSLALKKGFRLGFQASSDHTSTHISYCNVWSEGLTNEAILAGMKARHVYGSTDNIIADVRSGEHFMGDEFTTKARPQLEVRLVGTQAFDKVHVIKDNNYVHTLEPGEREVQFDWTDFDARPGRTSYYYVRGEQEDGELVWVSPMWITYKP